MPRESRSFTRITGVRDPSLIVIACEGAATEPAYFRGVADRCRILGSRLKLRVLPTRQGNLSAPKYVLQQMDSYKKEYGIDARDELCLVIDRDPQSWEEEAIAEVAQSCAQKQYLLALSNPAFELWLLLHHEDISSLPQAHRGRLYANRNGALKREIKAHVEGYQSSAPDIDDFWHQTEQAISRAKSLDTDPASRWPNALGTRVYLILEKILAAMESAG